MKLHLSAHRVAQFGWSKAKTGRLIRFESRPGFIGLYGRMPFTQNLMVAVGIGSSWGL